MFEIQILMKVVFLINDQPTIFFKITTLQTINFHLFSPVGC